MHNHTKPHLGSACDIVQDVTPGKIAFTKPTPSPEEAQEQVALFKPADLRESSLKLRPGDKVEFSIVQQETVPEDLATDVTLVSRASANGGVDGKPLMGCVISVKEGFGFIRWAFLLMSLVNAMQPYALYKGSSDRVSPTTMFLSVSSFDMSAAVSWSKQTWFTGTYITILLAHIAHEHLNQQLNQQQNQHTTSQALALQARHTSQ